METRGFAKVNMLERLSSIAVIVLLIAGGAGGLRTDVQETVPVESSGGAAIETVAKQSAGDAVSSASASGDYVYWKTIRARVTAYDPSWRSCGKFADGKTSIGRNAWRTDGVATDPKAIPYGSIVHIPGIGFRTVDDTGSQMKKSWSRGLYHIDVRMLYHHQARRWGNQYMDVKLYRKGV